MCLFGVERYGFCVLINIFSIYLCRLLWMVDVYDGLVIILVLLEFTVGLDSLFNWIKGIIYKIFWEG